MIWIYLPYVDAQAAGMQRYASQMIVALHRSGLRFELIVGELHGEPAWLKDITYRVAIGGGVSRRLPRPLVAFARLLWLQFAFPAATGAMREDVFLALGHELPPFPRTRQIAVVHDLTDFKSFSGRDTLATRARNTLWKAGLRRSARVIAISQATRDDLLDVFRLDPRRVEVVYEGFDPYLFRPAAAPATRPSRFLLYAGTLDPHKNVAFLLNVFGRLRGQFPDLRLKLVGRHDAGRRAALLAAVLPPLRADIDFLGFVSDAELAALMGQCAAFVFPSRNEGFGLAPVEAMACGAPVLAAGAGSLPEVIGEGGVLLSPNDVDAWVSELARILSDDTYRAELSARALTRSHAFSWDDAASAYRRLLTPLSDAEASRERL